MECFFHVFFTLQKWCQLWTFLMIDEKNAWSWAGLRSQWDHQCGFDVPNMVAKYLWNLDRSGWLTLYIVFFSLWPMHIWVSASPWPHIGGWKTPSSSQADEDEYFRQWYRPGSGKLLTPAKKKVSSIIKPSQSFWAFTWRFLKKRGTPRYHPFFFEIFHYESSSYTSMLAPGLISSSIHQAPNDLTMAWQESG